MAELLDIFVFGDLLQAHASGDLAVHAEDGGNLLFGEQENLEHQVVALVCAAAHAGLAHEDEAGEQNGFKGEDGAKQRKRGGVEVPDGSDGQRIDCDPCAKDDDMEQNEGEAAGEGRDGIGEALGGRAASQELLLVLGDEVDVLLDVVLRHV